jgi:hypothetical protein
MPLDATISVTRTPSSVASTLTSVTSLKSEASAVYVTMAPKISTISDTRPPYERSTARHGRQSTHSAVL